MYAHSRVVARHPRANIIPTKVDVAPRADRIGAVRPWAPPRLRGTILYVWHDGCQSEQGQGADKPWPW